MATLFSRGRCGASSDRERTTRGCTDSGACRHRLSLPRLPSIGLGCGWQREGPAAVHRSARGIEVPARQRSRDVPRDVVCVRRDVGGEGSRLFRHAGAVRLRDADVTVQQLRDDIFAARGVRAGAPRVGGAADGNVLGRSALLRSLRRAHHGLLVPRSEWVRRRRRGRGARQANEARGRLDRRHSGPAGPERHCAARGSVPLQQEHAGPAVVLSWRGSRRRVHRDRSVEFQRRPSHRHGRRADSI